MFHLSDLISRAGPAPWTPQDGDAAEAVVLRYRRRGFPSQPDDAPRLKLPEVAGLECLRKAVEAIGGDVRAAAALGACLESPVLTYVSPRLPSGARRWWRLALLDDHDIAALTCIEGVPRRRSTILDRVGVELCELSDLDAIRSFLERILVDADRPVRSIRNRGRDTAPRAAWVGLPPEPSVEFLPRLTAVAAIAGYRLEVVPDPKASVRPALQRIAELSPELVFLWERYVPLSFIGRAMALRIPGTVERIDPATESDALDCARIGCTLSPVVARAPATRPKPATMREAALLAREQCHHLVITDQAIERAAVSPYESWMTCFKRC